MNISLLWFNEVHSVICGLGDPFQIEVSLQRRLVQKPAVATEIFVCEPWRSELGNGELGVGLNS